MQPKNKSKSMFPWQTFGFLVYLAVFVNAWISPQQRLTDLRSADSFLQCQFEQDQLQKGRRNLLATSTSFVGLILLSPRRSDALVKGVAPPPKIAKTMTDTNYKPKCTNVEECQAMAERREQELKEEEERLPPPQITKEGTRFRDIQLGEGDCQVEIGDVVKMYFKVLKLGKRSYDGISGEGTVVFSRGYGFEDDEQGPGQVSFTTTAGAPQNIQALNDALFLMKVGGIRRFSILPQRGWEKPTKLCDGGPGGQGAGGDLKTDFVVVPTATMVSTESCFDSTKLPFPANFGEQRRMAQRFDQSLIMEIQLVAIDKK